MLIAWQKIFIPPFWRVISCEIANMTCKFMWIFKNCGILPNLVWNFFLLSVPNFTTQNFFFWVFFCSVGCWMYVCTCVRMWWRCRDDVGTDAAVVAVAARQMQCIGGQWMPKELPWEAMPHRHQHYSQRGLHVLRLEVCNIPSLLKVIPRAVCRFPPRATTLKPKIATKTTPRPLFAQLSVFAQQILHNCANYN